MVHLDQVIVDTGLTHTLRAFTNRLVQVVRHLTAVMLETADLVLASKEHRLPLRSVPLLNEIEVTRLDCRGYRFKLNRGRRTNTQTEKLLWGASRKDVCLCNLHLSYQSQNILSH